MFLLGFMLKNREIVLLYMQYLGNLTSHHPIHHMIYCIQSKV